jgi:hypothetical protein
VGRGHGTALDVVDRVYFPHCWASYLAVSSTSVRVRRRVWQIARALHAPLADQVAQTLTLRPGGGFAQPRYFRH